MKKLYIFIPILVVAGIIGFTKLPSSKSEQTKNDETTINNDAANLQASVADPSKDLIIGKADAKATIIEYGDFKCPSCNQFHHNAGAELRNNYIDSGQLKIVFKPIAVIGPDSERSAVGAYCANKQSKFVEYHDALFNYMWDNYYKKANYSVESQDLLTTDVIKTAVKNTSIDTNILSTCIESGTEVSTVAANLTSAENSGVRGTPTFIINGKNVVGPQPYANFKTLVDIQLR